MTVAMWVDLCSLFSASEATRSQRHRMAAMAIRYRTSNGNNCIQSQSALLFHKMRKRGRPSHGSEWPFYSFFMLCGPVLQTSCVGVGTTQIMLDTIS